MLVLKRGGVTSNLSLGFLNALVLNQKVRAEVHDHSTAVHAAPKELPEGDREARRGKGGLQRTEGAGIREEKLQEKKINEEEISNRGKRPK